jgi:hypothetical protein
MQVDLGRLQPNTELLFKSPHANRGLPSIPQNVVFLRRVNEDEALVRVRVGQTTWRRRVVKACYLYPVGYCFASRTA